MVTEIQKLDLLQSLLISKIHQHEIFLDNDSLPQEFREHFESKLRLERVILSDINLRLSDLFKIYENPRTEK